MKLKLLFLFLVFFFIVSDVDADDWTYNSRNFTIWSNQTSTFYDFQGEAIIPNYNLTGIEVVLYGTQETPTKCFLKTLLNVTLDSASFSGLRCYIDEDLTKGEKYWVGYGGTGSVFGRAFADLSTGSPIGNLPTNMSSFYVINSVQCHTGTCTNLTAYWIGNYGLNASTTATGGDTTPPSISVSQSPNNFTYQTVIGGYNIVSAIITDATGINNNSVMIYIQKNDSNVIINGTLRSNSFNKTYTNATGTNYSWYLDENDILGTISNLDPELFENTTHDYLAVNGANNIVKIQFLNVSNNAPLNILEYMTDNDTGTPSLSSYYYCNSSYTTGNPTSDANCVLFYSALNNLPYNHTHVGGLSKHKIMPLNINPDTGKIGNVYVTPTSYILKKGTTSGDRVYYINVVSRTDAIQTSNNNGNTWTSQAYTVDSHIHLIYNTSSINYKVCANDTATPLNSACSIWYGDIIDRFTLPPLTVTIYSPLTETAYMDELLINHSVSFSPTSTITRYDYFWRHSNLSFWYNIYNNTALLTTYLWDIYGFSAGFYDLKVITRDSTGLSGDSYVYSFYINSTDGAVLEDILNRLDAIEQNQEASGMLFGLILIPLVLGIMFLVASFLMSEEHTIIKIFFFGLSFLSATASLYMGSVGITYIAPTDTAVQTAIGNMMQWVSWVDYIILIYIFIFVTIHILKALKQDKEERLKY